MSEIIKGRLQISPTKKGKEYKAVYQLPGKEERPMPILPQARYFSEADAMDGAIICIELNANKAPAKVTIEGKPEHIPVQKTPPRPAHGSGSGNRTPYGGNNQGNPPHHAPSGRGGHSTPAKTGDPGRFDATAPYNFVPFDRNLVVQELPLHQEGERWSGTLHCTLEAITPLLVAGPQEEKDENQPTKRTFLEVGGVKAIPGTSIKGMLRSMIETLSYSRLAPVNDAVLPFRNFDDAVYRNRMGTDPAHPVQKAGWLVRVGTTYTLYEAEWLQKGRGDKYQWRTPSCPPGWEQIATGNTIPRKGVKPGPNIYFISPRNPAAKQYAVDRDLVRQFKEQLSRAQEGLLKDRGSNTSLSKPVPVFFLVDSTAPDTVFFMGLPRCFRLPYANTLAQCTGNDQKKGLDFASRLFGQAEKKDSFKGRVSVRPALLQGAKLDRQDGYIAILGQPAPTCLAHYLEQGKAVKTLPEARTRNDIKTMTTYNTDSPALALRGRKFYWHRIPSFAQIKASADAINNNKVKSTLYPVQVGTRGAFTIALDRVTPEELGALLLALELPAGHAHKLGAGKALGFGSVRITVDKVAVATGAERYSSLAGRFAQKEASTLSEAQKAACKKAFKERILQELRAHGCQTDSYDALPAIASLWHMLDFDKRPDEADIANMPLNGDPGYNTKAVLEPALKVQKRK